MATAKKDKKGGKSIRSQAVLFKLFTAAVSCESCRRPSGEEAEEPHILPASSGGLGLEISTFSTCYTSFLKHFSLFVSFIFIFFFFSTPQSANGPDRLEEFKEAKSNFLLVCQQLSLDICSFIHVEKGRRAFSSLNI